MLPVPGKHSRLIRLLLLEGLLSPDQADRQHDPAGSRFLRPRTASRTMWKPSNHTPVR